MTIPPLPPAPGAGRHPRWTDVADDPAARSRWVEATRIARLLTPAARARGGFASAVVVALPDDGDGPLLADVVLSRAPPPADGVLRRQPDLVVLLADARGWSAPPPRGTHLWLSGPRGVTVVRGGTRQLVRGARPLPAPPGFPALRVPAAAVTGTFAPGGPAGG